MVAGKQAEFAAVQYHAWFRKGRILAASRQGKGIYMVYGRLAKGTPGALSQDLQRPEVSQVDIGHRDPQTGLPETFLAKDDIRTRFLQLRRQHREAPRVVSIAFPSVDAEQGDVHTCGQIWAAPVCVPFGLD